MQLIRPVLTCPWHRRRWERTTVASVTGVMLTLFHLLRLTAGAEPSSSSSFSSPPQDDGVRHLSWCNNRKSATLLFLLISCHMTPDELLQAWTRSSQFFLLLHLCDVIQRGSTHLRFKPAVYTDQPIRKKLSLKGGRYEIKKDYSELWLMQSRSTRV